jgi:hypothetical protein
LYRRGEAAKPVIKALICWYYLTRLVFLVG